MRPPFHYRRPRRKSERAPSLYLVHSCARLRPAQSRTARGRLVRSSRPLRSIRIGSARCSTAVAVLALLRCVVVVVSLLLSLSPLTSLALPVRPLPTSAEKQRKKKKTSAQKTDVKSASRTWASRPATRSPSARPPRLRAPFSVLSKLLRLPGPPGLGAPLNAYSARTVNPIKPSRRRRLDTTAPRRSAGRKAFLAPSLPRGLRPRVLMAGRGTLSPSGSLRGFRPSARASLSPTGCSGTPWE